LFAPVSASWLLNVKRSRGKKLRLDAAPFASRFQLFCPPARALAVETMTLERTLSDLVNQADALTPAEIGVLWKTAPPRMPTPPPAT
jgi:hypothetical protein